MILLAKLRQCSQSRKQQRTYTPQMGPNIRQNKGLTNFARSESNSSGYFCIKEKEMLLTPEQKEKSSELFMKFKICLYF